MLIFSFIIGFDAHEEFELTDLEPETDFSIIIPFRNEANNLPCLLNSISKLDYPFTKLEVILVNDYSSDNFQEIIDEFQLTNPEISIKLLKNRQSNSPKKSAIKQGIKASKYPFIVTTDADCEVPKNWLKALDTKIRFNDSNMVCAPVSIVPNQSIVNIFERLNFNSLQGSTIGSFGIQFPFICNGANLCYSKELFNELGGFSGNEKIASGDDVFLLEKFVKFNKTKVHFLKSTESVVLTKGQESFKDFLQQQIRWAKKSSAYKNWNSRIIGSLVFFTNILLLGTLIFSFSSKINLSIVFICFLFKLMIDFILIQKTNSFLNQSWLNYFVIPSSILYPIFMITVFIFSLGKDFSWKERKFNR